MKSGNTHANNVTVIAISVLVFDFGDDFSIGVGSYSFDDHSISTHQRRSVKNRCISERGIKFNDIIIIQPCWFNTTERHKSFLSWVLKYLEYLR
ncbi:MAG: hypothetical protein [Cressdnaviricota sp.]|nr:MAG: hypothetical protein [Cressdnaviricota sp.]